MRHAFPFLHRELTEKDWAPAGKHSGSCHYVFSYFYSAYLVAKSIFSSQMRKNCIKPQHWNVICKSLAFFVSKHRLYLKNSFVSFKILECNKNELQMIQNVKRREYPPYSYPEVKITTRASDSGLCQSDREERLHRR